MGVERSVIRWYVRRQLLLDEIIAIETNTASSSVEGDAMLSQEESDALQKLRNAQEKLRVLGSCPRPMMG